MTEVTELERAAKAARKIKELQAQIAELEEAVENLKAKEVEYFNESLGEHVVGDNDNGFLKVTIYQSKTFNEAWGKKLAPELWAEFAESKTVLTSARAKDKLSGDDYALFQKPSAKLSVKVEVISE
jgi:hypothetical protein